MKKQESSKSEKQADVVIETKDHLMFFEVTLSKDLDKKLEKEVEFTSGTIPMYN